MKAGITVILGELYYENKRVAIRAFSDHIPDIRKMV